MITTLQDTDRRTWESLREQVDVRRRHCLIVASLIKVERRDVRKDGGHRLRRPQLVARPAAAADEGRRDQEDADGPCGPVPIRQVVDEDGGADRVANQDGGIAELPELPIDRLLPSPGVWVRFVGHPRITDGIASTQCLLEAGYELVVP